MLNLGLRAHDAGKDSAENLAEKIASHGLSCTQLTLQDAITGMEDIAGRLNPGIAWQTGEAFRKSGVQIAVLSSYFNPLEPDPQQRKQQIGNFKELVHYARDFGCGIVATETGSYHSDFSFHPDNHSNEAFTQLIPTLCELVEEAENFGVTVCIEAVLQFVIHDPNSTLRMLKTISSNNLQVLLDPVNLVDQSNYDQQDKLIKEAFSLYGERISVLHVKDFIMRDGRKVIVPFGKGLLNIPLVMELALKYKPGINTIIEEMDFQYIDQNVNYLKSI